MKLTIIRYIYIYSLLLDTRMKKTISVGLIAGVVTTAMILSTTLGDFSVFASSNEWGDLASDLGQAGKMGEHASDPDHDGNKGQDDNPRVGVGNIDLAENDGNIEDDDGDKAHPSETADILRSVCDSIEEDDPRCP